MNPLRLVNPQPMETFPKHGSVFMEYHYSTGAIDTEIEDAANIGSNHRGYVAWSYTATFEPLEGVKKL